MQYVNFITLSLVPFQALVTVPVSNAGVFMEATVAVTKRLLENKYCPITGEPLGTCSFVHSDMKKEDIQQSYEDFRSFKTRFMFSYGIQQKEGRGVEFN